MYPGMHHRDDPPAGGDILDDATDAADSCTGGDSGPVLSPDEKEAHCLTFARTQCLHYFFTLESSGDTLADVKSIEFVTTLRQELTITTNHKADVAFVTIGVTRAGKCRTTKIALQLHASHSVAASQVMRALYSAVGTVGTIDGEIGFHPEDQGKFHKKARRILAPDEPVEVDPYPFVHGEPRYVQLQHVHNKFNGQRRLKPISLVVTEETRKEFEQYGSWPELWRSPLYQTGSGPADKKKEGALNPLLFRLCYDMFCSPGSGEQGPGVSDFDAGTLQDVANGRCGQEGVALAGDQDEQERWQAARPGRIKRKQEGFVPTGSMQYARYVERFGNPSKLPFVSASSRTGNPSGLGETESESKVVVTSRYRSPWSTRSLYTE